MQAILMHETRRSRTRPRRQMAGPGTIEYALDEDSVLTRVGNSAAEFRIGLLVPLRGPIGLFGPSSINCAMLAANEINERGGILGRRVKLVIGDGGGPTGDIVAEAERMIAKEGVQAIVGSHISSNRLALVKRIGGRIPYVYTTTYEGGQYSFGVFVCGETPEQQLRPLIRWLARNRAVRRWYVIGNDYIFPHVSIALAKRYIAEVEGRVVGEQYVSFFVDDYHSHIERIVASKADAVLIYLVGEDGITFNRQFAAHGVDRSIIRAAPILCENMLLGIGVESTRNLYSAAGFTECMKNGSASAFRSDYRRAFGANSPIPNRFGVSCYDGLHLLSALSERARSLNLFKLQAAAEGTSFRGPRGECTMIGNHCSADVYITEAVGMDIRPIDAVGTIKPPAPDSAVLFPKDQGTA